MEELILRDSVQSAIEGKTSEANEAPKAQSSVVDEKLRKELESIPDKMAFKIGEVADLLDVKTYVLRYWETEFDALNPRKSASNQRMYSRKDVETSFLIKKLLYRDRFSIEGARKALKSLKEEVKEQKEWDQVADRYGKAISELENLIETIDAAKVHYI